MAKLYFRYGTMASGKSTELLQVVFNYKQQNKNVLLWKPKRDKKAEDKVVSRIGIEAKVDRLLEWYELTEDLEKWGKEDFTNVSCLIIDEAQFLTKEQVQYLWKFSKEKDIPVMCYGLRNNFKGEPFEASALLMAIADDIKELKTICSHCDRKATMNARIVAGQYVRDGEETVIDGEKLLTKYEPLCGKCYLERVIKKTKNLF